MSEAQVAAVVREIAKLAYRNCPARDVDIFQQLADAADELERAQKGQP
jgi:hypothetical protein